MLQSTLCILVKGDEVLLAMKKRGFGEGKWNGVGGKLDSEKDKDIVDTVVRETKEEIGVDIKDMKRVAILNFRFPYKEEWNQDVHVFLASNWDGEPIESEEMAPKWFKKAEVPFDSMWDDDKYWLPYILEGKKMKADFIFKEGESVDNHKIEFVEEI